MACQSLLGGFGGSPEGTWHSFELENKAHQVDFLRGT